VVFQAGMAWGGVYSPGLTSLLKETKDEVTAEAAGEYVDWTQFQHDAQHSGRTSVRVAPPAASNYYTARWVRMATGTLRTNFTSGSGLSVTDGLGAFTADLMFANSVQPIVVQGKIYIGALNGKVYCYDALTGAQCWSFTTGGPIVATAAYINGVVAVGSMDGKVYGLNPSTGAQTWVFTTGAGISAHIAAQNNKFYVGSRDGKVYAINSAAGTQAWVAESAVPGDTDNLYKNMPILAAPAVTADGTKVFFVSENMYAYMVSATDGTQSWTPKHMYGQSTAFTVPVIYNDTFIMAYTQNTYYGTEEDIDGMESVLEGVRPTHNASDIDTVGERNTLIANEATAFRNFFAADSGLSNPRQQVLQMYNVSNGNYPFASRVPMGRVTGENKGPLPPVITADGPLTYWRSSFATLFNDGSTFGTQYCPDLSLMDTSTGVRKPIMRNSGGTVCPEIDNGFMLTMADDVLYMQSSFRGVISIDMAVTNASPYTVSGNTERFYHSLADYDGGNFRGYPYRLILYGNDGTGGTDTRKETDLGNNNIFHPGVVPVQVNGTKMLIMNLTEGACGGQSCINKVRVSGPLTAVDGQ